MINKKQWSMELNFKAKDEKIPTPKLLTYAPVNIENSTWILCVAASYKKVIAQNKVYLVLSIVLILLL